MSDQPNHGVDTTPQIQAEDKTAVPPANPGAEPPAPPAPGQQPPLGGADAPPGIYNPNNSIPDHLLGQDDKGTIDKLSAAYKGAREEPAKGKPAVPEAKDYQFNWSDKVKGAGGIAADDQAVAAFAEIANKRGLTQDQVGAVNEFFELAIDKGWIEKPFDSGQLLTELAPPEFRGTPEEKQARGAQRLQLADSWISQLDPKTSGMDDAMKQELRLLTTSVAGVRVVEQFMKSGMNPSVSPGGGHMPAAVTKSDIDARIADPRNNFTDPKFDPAYAEETRNMFKKLYPGDA